MLAYVIRRMLYAFPILLGVNLLLFLIFFGVNTPDDMAEAIIGEKHSTPELLENWKREHGYHLPRFFNAGEGFPGMFTQTIFWQKSMRLFLFDFGKSDADDSDIGTEVKRRVPYSLFITVPAFLVAMVLNLFFAMLVAFYRGTYVDHWALVLCVLMMSISQLFYIIGGQFLLAIDWRLLPVSGFDTHLLYTWKFLLLPVVIAVISGLGGGIRYYRTVFLEEINKDYVRTARAKGLGEGTVLFKHVLKNAMLPILTNVVVSIPFLIMGSLLLENFFGIPGLGSFVIDAIGKQDFAVIRGMVFLSSVLYVAALICVDISYTLVDPRIRLG
jgi:peptide/nickel transport system permease protein